MVTRKDMEIIAKHLRKVNGARNTFTTNVCAELLCEILLDLNPRFDKTKFLAACGLL